jgi:murein hydrolase activator
MILRRSSRAEPCLMLGQALAFVLPFGANWAAFAQNPVPPAPIAEVPSSQAAPAPPPTPQSSLDLLKQHDQELDAMRAKQKVSLEEQNKLKREIEAIGADRAALNQQLIDTATHVRDVEASVDATQARLNPLDERERVFRTSLEERRTTIIEILAALQRIGRQPPPALVVKPEDALQAVRTAIILGAVVPEMRSEADALASDLAELLRVRKDIDAEHARLNNDLALLAREQLRLNILIDERQQKEQSTAQALDVQKQHAADLANQADSLKDLIGKLEQGLDSTSRETRLQARAIEEDATRPDLAALNDPGRMTPAIAFAATRGHLHLPVNGIRVREFGASDGVGGSQKGLSIAARASANITAPCDGWVVYAGPFRGYGQLLILNAGGGYHVLLAGMERISVNLGQFVLTGEPVAIMGGGSQVSATVATGTKQPVLYVEFRKDGTPIDPSPWWATNEGEKVRG